MELHSGFLFRCYGTLKSRLGELDAAIECNEIALRQFAKEMGNSGDSGAYLTRLSEQHNIRLNVIDAEFMKSRIAQLYILSVYQQLEKFCVDFRDECPHSNKWNYDSKNRAPLLHSILDNITDSQSYKYIQYKIDICEYYRLSRNYFMHAGVKEKSIDIQLSKVRESSEKIFNQYKVELAPNEVDALSFEDFILFSRAGKDLAAELCRLGRPSDSDIVDMILALDQQKGQGVNLSNMRKYRYNPIRLNRALDSLLKTLYHLDTAEGQPIVEELIDRLQINSGR